jgi:DNA repair protein RadD
LLLTPHAFQDEASESPFKHYADGKKGNVLIQMPTGTGKSVVIADFCRKVFQRYTNQKIIIATHVKELVRQNYQKMLEIWPNAPAGINSAGLRQRDTVNPIIFAGIGSVAKYAEQFGNVDVVWVDECHRVGEEETSYINFINALKAMNPNLITIGSTATPWRMGLGHLTEGVLFDDVCFDITYMEAFNRLINEGYLCPLIPKRTETYLDTGGVHLRGGEFIAGELQYAVDRDELTAKACAEAIDLGHDRKHWIAFATGVEHAIHTADILNGMGVRSIAIHNKLSPTDRDNAIQGWKAGYYRCAVNNNILTTGIDFPGIDLMLILRPTMSSILWVQMLGRGTRCVYAKGFDIVDYEQRMHALYEGGKRNCLVLDYARNCERLGPINDPVIPRKKGDMPGDPPIRICEQCGTYNHASARICIGCGYEFPVATKLRQEASTTEIIKGMALPEVKIYDIDHITYSLHNKQGSPPSMRVSYYSGIRCFNEYICFEHQSYAGKRARIWWRQHSSLPVPEKTADAVSLSDQLKPATNLRVRVDTKHPEILDYCFDASKFGTIEVSENFEPPTVEIRQPRNWSETNAPKTGTQDLDDDIPF